MNVTELARKLRMHPEELKTRLPELGFDVGMRAIKVDDRIAQKIIQQWPILRRQIEKKRQMEKEEKIAEDVRKVAEAAPPVKIPAVVTVRDFALRLGLPVTRVIQELMKNGILASLNERLDFETASIVAEDLGFRVEREEEESGVALVVEDRIRALVEAEEKDKLVARPPVIVVMGHVDHGKTKLLDFIRKTNVMAGEAGGITQHIGAYQATKNGRLITFVDTPGHEAFTAMRSRGARIADIAILVVAADDGVQPQTKEAVNIIKAAGIPFAVAINKIDKPDADPERVKRELSEVEVIPEEWGGKVSMIPISAKTGAGIDKLLEIILLIADLEKEKIVDKPERRGVRTVIESHVDKGEGPVATVLIQAGTLRAGEDLAVGNSLYGRVRAMKDFRGAIVKSALPGTPVRIIGIKVAPSVGDIVEVPENAKELERVRPAKAAGEKMATVERRAAVLETEETKAVATVNLVLRADVLGSLEAVITSLEKFKHPEVAPNVVGKGLGNVTEADVLRAEAAKTTVLGFNVLTPQPVANLAAEKGVVIKTFKIIYDLLEEVRAALEALLQPEVIRTTLGKIKILAIFRSEKDAQIVGGLVADGKAVLGGRVRIIRGEAEEGLGEVASLQAGKRDVPEVRAGTECGMKIKTKTAVQVGDVLEIYSEERRERKFVV